MIRKIVTVVFIVMSLFVLWQVVATLRAKSELDNVPDAFIVAGEDTDIILVEFLDYDCVHCRNIHPVLKEALEKDGHVRYIPRPLPSASETGRYAGRLAFAAALQGEFPAMHHILIENYDTLDKQSVQDFALLTGLDAQQLEEDSKSEAAEQFLVKNMRVFAEMGGQYTPTFFINNDTMVVLESTSTDVNTFLDLFAQTRRGK